MYLKGNFPKANENVSIKNMQDTDKVK